MKITNDHLFDLMEILGLIGIDVEIKDDEEKTGIAIINAVFKNAKKAQNEVEALLKNLTGVDTSTPLGLVKAVGKVKKDKEIMDFFKSALDAFLEE
jgi:hypothetical protein